MGMNLHCKGIVGDLYLIVHGSGNTRAHYSAMLHLFECVGAQRNEGG
jgi:hypothetical protein